MVQCRLTRKGPEAKLAMFTTRFASPATGELTRAEVNGDTTN